MKFDAPSVLLELVAPHASGNSGLSHERIFVPQTDPSEVGSQAEAFDLSAPSVEVWELSLIWLALDRGLLKVSPHAAQAAVDESIPLQDIMKVIRDGQPVSKDLTTINGRKIGINFEGKVSGGRTIRVKVGWFSTYWVVTVHTV